MGIELKEEGSISALYRNGTPLPHTTNKSEEYLEGFILGLARGEHFSR